LPNLQTLKLGGLFRGLFYGISGTGKTVAAGSFPGPIKFYDFDDRISPLKLWYPNRTDMEWNTVTVTDSSRKDSISLIDFLREFHNLRERCDYETVVIDSITGLSNAIFLYVRHIEGDSGFKKKVLPKVDLHDYQKETSTMLEVLETIKLLPCHVICTAHPITKTEMEEPGKLESMRSIRSLTGYGSKTPSMIPNGFNEMYWFYNQTVEQMGQKPKRFICTVANGEIPAKTALPLKPTMEITDLPLFNLIQKELNDYNIRLETAREAKKAVQKGDVVTT